MTGGAKSSMLDDINSIASTDIIFFIYPFSFSARVLKNNTGALFISPCSLHFDQKMVSE